jgi:alanine dehydrogenase
MRVGVPKEIKTLEYRVGMVPAGVSELVHDGHEVIVETNAGTGIGLTDSKNRSSTSARCSARTMCCSLTCTWRQIRRRPKRW